MDDFSILIGGKAGDGIDKAGMLVAHLFNQLGFNIYIHRDYPSIIRGGHTFSIVRSSKTRVFAHTDSVDVVLAINKDAVKLHLWRLKPTAALVYDPETINEDELEAMKPPGFSAVCLPVPATATAAAAGAPPVVANSAMVGAAAKVLGVDWSLVETVFNRRLTKATDKNLATARRGYDAVDQTFETVAPGQSAGPLLTGNEALGLGLVAGGLNTYIAYPMTPTSNLLHFLAKTAERFGLKVVHPESEIGVILMALGCSWAGESAAVGTSGGGFCLMTEGYSFAAMAELPVVIVLGQRPGPSTGLPTYSSQTELGFALSAGQGEFTRFVVAPGDGEECFIWARIVLALAAKYATPAILIVDKVLAEHVYSFDETVAGLAAPGVAPARERSRPYKINSYEHDESGLTTERADLARGAQERRLAKTGALAAELSGYRQIGVFGDEQSATAILCWGSNKGVCVEVARELGGLKVIQPIVMSPFPIEQFKAAMAGVRQLIAVENNAEGQLARLAAAHGFAAEPAVLKYDGRPFSLEELGAKLAAVRKGAAP